MNGQNQNESFKTIGSLMSRVSKHVIPEGSISNQSKKHLSTIGYQEEKHGQTGMQLLGTGCGLRTLPVSQSSLNNPMETAQRAMNAVSWLASPERKTLTTGTKYEMLYNQETGLDDWLPCRPIVNFDRTQLTPAVQERLLQIIELAGLREINYHVNRILLHRRKGGLGELSLPQFVDDIAGMIRREGATSLGAALLVDYLIRHARNTWFPEWCEISAALGQIESELIKIRRELTGEVLPEIEYKSNKARAVVERVDLTGANEKWERDMARLEKLGYTLGSIKRGQTIDEFCNAKEKEKSNGV